VPLARPLRTLEDAPPARTARANSRKADSQDSVAMSAPGPDALTPDQERWLSGHLWAGLRAPPCRDGSHMWDAPITPKKRKNGTVAVICGRCQGAGAIASFSARYSGKCFPCGGSGVLFISKAAYARRAATAPRTSGR
jgi:hypothetical protein